MEKKSDRRIRRTKALLRHGLAQLMSEKSVNEVTVKELVDLVDINRSTFYLHYTDIYNMLESVEDELFDEILHTIRTHPVSPFNKDSFPFIEDIFAILFDNREICAALLGPHGDIGFLHRIEEMLSQYSLAALREAFPERMDNLKYTYAYCVAGGVGLIATAFIGLPMVADMLILLGGGAAVIAIALVVIWLAIWLFIRMVIGWVRLLVRLGKRWCRKEIAA